MPFDVNRTAPAVAEQRTVIEAPPGAGLVGADPDRLLAAVAEERLARAPRGSSPARLRIPLEDGRYEHRLDPPPRRAAESHRLGRSRPRHPRATPLDARERRSRDDRADRRVVRGKAPSTSAPAHAEAAPEGPR